MRTERSVIIHAHPIQSHLRVFGRAHQLCILHDPILSCGRQVSVPRRRLTVGASTGSSSPATWSARAPRSCRNRSRTPTAHRQHRSCGWCRQCDQDRKSRETQPRRRRSKTLVAWSHGSKPQGRLTSPRQRVQGAGSQTATLPVRGDTTGSARSSKHRWESSSRNPAGT